MTRQQKMMLFTLFLGVLAVLYLAVILRKADASYSCEYEEPIDVCSNLEGNQAVVPDGYLTDGDYCYVPEVPKEEPTPGLPGNPPTFAGSSTDAPGVCSASIPNAPANPLVWRKGGSAIVQWLPDGTANQARIYWRINGQATKETGNLQPYLQQLSRYDAREIKEFEDAISLSADIAVRALKAGMMSSSTEAQIKDKIKMFLTPEETKAHGRLVDSDRAEKCGLVIEKLTLDNKIWIPAYELYIRLNNFVSSQVAKCVENSKNSYGAHIERV